MVKWFGFDNKTLQSSLHALLEQHRDDLIVNGKPLLSTFLKKRPGQNIQSAINEENGSRPLYNNIDFNALQKYLKEKKNIKQFLKFFRGLLGESEKTKTLEEIAAIAVNVRDTVNSHNKFSHQFEDTYPKVEHFKHTLTWNEKEKHLREEAKDAKIFDAINGPIGKESIKDPYTIYYVWSEKKKFIPHSLHFKNHEELIDCFRENEKIHTFFQEDKSYKFSREEYHPLTNTDLNEVEVIIEEETDNEEEENENNFSTNNHEESSEKKSVRGAILWDFDGVIAHQFPIFYMNDKLKQRLEPFVKNDQVEGARYSVYCLHPDVINLTLDILQYNGFVNIPASQRLTFAQGHEGNPEKQIMLLFLDKLRGKKRTDLLPQHGEIIIDGTNDKKTNSSKLKLCENVKKIEGLEHLQADNITLVDDCAEYRDEILENSYRFIHAVTNERKPYSNLDKQIINDAFLFNVLLSHLTLNEIIEGINKNQRLEKKFKDEFIEKLTKYSNNKSFYFNNPPSHLTKECLQNELLRIENYQATAQQQQLINTIDLLNKSLKKLEKKVKNTEFNSLKYAINKFVKLARGEKEKVNNSKIILTTKINNMKMIDDTASDLLCAIENPQKKTSTSYERIKTRWQGKQNDRTKMLYVSAISVCVILAIGCAIAAAPTSGVTLIPGIFFLYKAMSFTRSLKKHNKLPMSQFWQTSKDILETNKVLNDKQSEINTVPRSLLSKS